MLENRMHPNGVEDDALCKIILNLAPKFSSIKCVSSLREGSFQLLLDICYENRKITGSAKPRNELLGKNVSLL